ncbi:MAG TPA: hypothetical protein VJ183_20100 [Chloroflexia bacterium]|nr:hypothetical protein [Chloroflexia bacterium]
MPEMHRGKSQVLFRYTPYAMFRYNETNAWCEVTSIPMANTRSLSEGVAEALYQLLHAWDAIGSDNFPDPRLFPNKYEVGEPYQVHYTLRPLVFVCKVCKRVQWYSDLDQLSRYNYNLNCRQCKGVRTLMQIPYIYIHECGRAENVFIPKHPTDHVITLNNRGRFQESNWYCQTCRRPLTKPGTQGLGKRACQCGKKKLQRGTTLQDPAVHYNHTLSLVDTEDPLLAGAGLNPQLGENLLAGLLRTPHYNPADFKDLLQPAPGEEETETKREQMRQDLKATGLTDPNQIEMLIGIMLAQVASPVADTQRRLRKEVRDLLTEESPLIGEAAASRQLREYLFVRDHPRMQASRLSDLLRQATEQGDTHATERYTEDLALSESIGFADLRLLEKFPLLLAAVGYSRVQVSPAPGTTTALRPFDANKPKIPIYAIRSTTEAFMFEIDPWWEAAWLLENDWAEAPNAPFTSVQELRAWLLRMSDYLLRYNAAHLEQLTWEREKNHPVPETAVACRFGLLHTISHMLTIAATTQVGFEADSLAEYLFPVSSAGIVYATGHQEFTLGGIVSAFKLNLGMWLSATYEAAQRCIYDPLCRSRGSVCHACGYLRFSCPHFNRTVSRAFLLGGPVTGLQQDVVGYWSPRTHERSLRLKQEAGLLSLMS